MALGGGNWKQIDKELDGTYVNINSNGSNNNKLNYNEFEPLPTIGGVKVIDDKTAAAYNLTTANYLKIYVAQKISEFMETL